MQRTLLIIGILLILVALTWPRLKHLPLGRLLGDVVIERTGYTFFVPTTTMILVSLVLSLIAVFFQRRPNTIPR